MAKCCKSKNCSLPKLHCSHPLLWHPSQVPSTAKAEQRGLIQISIEKREARRRGSENLSTWSYVLRTQGVVAPQRLSVVTCRGLCGWAPGLVV